MNRLISTTTIKPVVDKVFAFEEYEEALRYLASQRHIGKVVIKVGSS
jgi:NADPH:quinone reductase-like Zn-dependent oxidoreductase